MRHLGRAVLLALGLAGPFALSQDPLPSGLAGQVPPGRRVLAWAAADLDRDGLRDVVALFERTTPEGEAVATAPRELRVFRRRSSSRLELAAQNDRLVPCAACGGGFGDPFASLEARRGGFSVGLHGGNTIRWNRTYVFGYARRHRRWELLQVEVGTQNLVDLEDATARTYQRPRDFGILPLSDFDPDAFLKAREAALPPPGRL